jgi:hypothetical protein
MQESFFARLISILSNVMDNILIQRQDVFDVFFSMFLAIAIALVISQIYKHTHRGMNFELSFMSTLVLLAPIVSVVMLFIRGDLVLSLGLIGSLSIIRFRTPIKDTRDMVFLFWTIAVGLGCGTYNWAIVIISTIFISIVIVSLYFLKYGRSESTDYILVVSGSTPSDNTSLEKIIHEYVEEVKMRSFEKSGQQWESIYELGFPKSKKMVVKNMINSIESLPEVSRVSLLAPQLALPV